MLSEATIDELRQILNDDYGVELDIKDAIIIAENLVNYFDLLLRIKQQEKE